MDPSIQHGVDRGFPGYMPPFGMSGMNQQRVPPSQIPRSQSGPLNNMMNMNMSQDSSHFMHPNSQVLSRSNPLYHQGPVPSSSVQNFPTPSRESSAGMHRTVSDSSLATPFDSNYPHGGGVRYMNPPGSVSMGSSMPQYNSSNSGSSQPGLNGSVPLAGQPSPMMAPNPAPVEDFSLQSEDFPALSKIGQPKGDFPNGANGDNFSLNGNNSNLQDKIPRDVSNVPPAATNKLTPQSVFASIEFQPIAVISPTSQKPVIDSKTSSKFGLLGLLDVMKVTDKDISTLSLGIDLGSLGLNLSSSDNIYPSFSSPFSDQSSEPQYSLPSCYLMNPPSLKQEYWGKFQLETLFYMFYGMPRDTLQVLAALELYRREWRYHGELRVWLSQTVPDSMAGNTSMVVFDVNEWKIKPHRGNIVNGFLTEEDIRSKINAGNSSAVAPSANANGNNNSANNGNNNGVVPSNGSNLSNSSSSAH